MAQIIEFGEKIRAGDTVPIKGCLYKAEYVFVNLEIAEKFSCEFLVQTPKGHYFGLVKAQNG